MAVLKRKVTAKDIEQIKALEFHYMDSTDAQAQAVWDIHRQLFQPDPAHTRSCFNCIIAMYIDLYKLVKNAPDLKNSTQPISPKKMEKINDCPFAFIDDQARREFGTDRMYSNKNLTREDAIRLLNGCPGLAEYMTFHGNSFQWVSPNEIILPEGASIPEVELIDQTGDKTGEEIDQNIDQSGADVSRETVSTEVSMETKMETLEIPQESPQEPQAETEQSLAKPQESKVLNADEKAEENLVVADKAEVPAEVPAKPAKKVSTTKKKS